MRRGSFCIPYDSMNSLPASDAEVLDVRGLKCPLPALLARRQLARSPDGHLLDVLADDPLAPIDVPYMCVKDGYEVIEVEKRETFTRIRLRKPV